MEGEKRSKQGSSSTIEEEGTMHSDNVQMLKDSIDCLRKVVSEGFAKLHEDMDKRRHEYKENLEGVKSIIKDIEESLSSTQENVESLREAVKNTSESSAYNIEAMNKRILDLEKQLKLETERNTKLEQYTRRKKSAVQQYQRDGEGRLQSHDVRHLTERSGAGHFFNKIPCGSSGGKTDAGKNKTDYSALRKPRGQKPCLDETREN